MESFLLSLYYRVKPLLPRAVQLQLRRSIALRRLSRCGDVWPIDERAGARPEGWRGWPEGRKFALVLTHDVEYGEGQSGCRALAGLESGLGFRSSFNFVPERYNVSPTLRDELTSRGFEVGVHGLCHDGKYYSSRAEFLRRASRINKYLKEWSAAGYRAPSMLSRLDWFHDLDIEYDASTFDTDPFEPQSGGVKTIFPFGVPDGNGRGYIELPYTLPQDFTIFRLLREKNIDIWKNKLDWIAEKGGMALLITHPDYMNFGAGNGQSDKYPAAFYAEFLRYVKKEYEGLYWHALPREMACFWNVKMAKNLCGQDRPLED